MRPGYKEMTEHTFHMLMNLKKVKKETTLTGIFTWIS